MYLRRAVQRSGSARRSFATGRQAGQLRRRWQTAGVSGQAVGWACQWRQAGEQPPEVLLSVVVARP